LFIEGFGRVKDFGEYGPTGTDKAFMAVTRLLVPEKLCCTNKESDLFF